MRKIKSNKTSNQINNINSQSKKRDRSGWYLGLFGILFAMVIGRAFLGGGAPMLGMPNITNSNRSTVLNFSDVLRRADDIQTMEIHGNDARGTLKDGTKYTATITYDPELLTKISESGANVSIDASRGFVDTLGAWLPILIGLFFIWWIFRGLRGGAAGGIGRSLVNQNPTKITTGKPGTTFKDVAGIDSEKTIINRSGRLLKKQREIQKRWCACSTWGVAVGRTWNW